MGFIDRCPYVNGYGRCNNPKSNFIYCSHIKTLENRQTIVGDYVTCNLIRREDLMGDGNTEIKGITAIPAFDKKVFSTGSVVHIKNLKDDKVAYGLNVNALVKYCSDLELQLTYINKQHNDDTVHVKASSVADGDIEVELIAMPYGGLL